MPVGTPTAPLPVRIDLVERAPEGDRIAFERLDRWIEPAFRTALAIL